MLSIISNSNIEIKIDWNNRKYVLERWNNEKVHLYINEKFSDPSLVSEIHENDNVEIKLIVDANHYTFNPIITKSNTKYNHKYWVPKNG